MGVNDDRDINEQDASISEEFVDSSLRSFVSSAVTTPRDDPSTVSGPPSIAGSDALPWLPDTVSVLRNEHTGGEIYLVGTAHFSRQSQDDVSTVIQLVRPNIVLVELCRARAAVLSMSEEDIERQAKNISFDKVKSTIAENGLVQGLVYLLFLNMSAHLTKTLGMAPGGEFRRALAEVKKLDNCNIHFGDRPINITIKRALSCLSWWQTIKLSATLLFKDANISAEEVEKCKQKDLLEAMLAEMSCEYPELGRVFVAERDLYLTWSLQFVSSLLSVGSSVVVNEADVDPDLPRQPVKVVAIVGIGHVPGIKKLWGTVTREDVEPVLYIPPPSKSGQVVKLVVKVSLLSLLAWGVYRVTPKLGRGLIGAVKVVPKLFVK